MQGYNAFLKRKMMISRIFGIFACLVAITGLVLKFLNLVITGLVLKFLNLVDDWLCLMMIVYSLGTIFALNGNLQDIKVGNPWQRINFACSVLMYLFVVFIIIYGFCTKQLTIQF